MSETQNIYDRFREPEVDILMHAGGDHVIDEVEGSFSGPFSAESNEVVPEIRLVRRVRFATIFAAVAAGALIAATRVYSTSLMLSLALGSMAVISLWQGCRQDEEVPHEIVFGPDGVDIVVGGRVETFDWKEVDRLKVTSGFVSFNARREGDIVPAVQISLALYRTEPNRPLRCVRADLLRMAQYASFAGSDSDGRRA